MLKPEWRELIDNATEVGIFDKLEKALAFDSNEITRSLSMRPVRNKCRNG